MRLEILKPTAFTREGCVSVRRLLVIRLDAIGDYILFRNFLPILREAGPFRGHRVTLCGNVAWKELAETFDRQWIDEFIWVNRPRYFKTSWDNLFPGLWPWFPRRWAYRNALMRRLRGYECDTVINPASGRDPQVDRLVEAIPARTKIAFAASLDPASVSADNRIYSRLVQPTSGNLFEFYRNREFFTTLIGQQIDVARPSLNATGVPLPRQCPHGPFVVVFPAASHWSKCWPPQAFAQVIRHIFERHGFPAVLTGGPSDTPTSRAVESRLSGIPVLNLTGQGDLLSLCAAIARSRLVLSNDTCAVHIAAAVGTPAVCVSSGVDQGRFLPYPREMTDRILCAFPPPSTFMNPYGRMGNLLRRTNWPLRAIKTEQVIRLVDELLSTRGGEPE